ncbi:hypothetical protein CLV28_0876 [Sediminihabitans luteus]|uniref:Uncharacterized protein n=1 Tax=Sediminihabitans luteus TaxID=1138585 RepID=A0A2M9D0D6_9CELL|nr:hypothetical protein [Sediminihabitans luteus]PJJ77651.1 hypothetical protein CLV28_0876 [Sediminihabitans luteus]GII98551.1 hypothetical protein Slu03_09290 [Sediminihabitans luteus]
MDPFAGIFALIVLAAFGGAIAVNQIARVRARERGEALAAWALARGWRSLDQDPYLPGRWAGTPFGEGDDRRATDVVRGVRHGYSIVSFTYRWTTVSTTSDGDGGRRTSRTNHHAHVVALDVPPSLPTVELTPQGLGSRIATFFGGQDVEVGWPPFDDAWRVRTSDEHHARSILDARATQRLVQPDVLGRPVRLEGHSLLTWVSGPTDVAGLDHRVDQVAELAQALGLRPDAVHDAPPPAAPRGGIPGPASSGMPDYGTPDGGTPDYGTTGYGISGHGTPDYGTSD